MGFIRAKEIPPGSGNWYDYEVENHREGDKVVQKHIRYIGRAGGSGGRLGTTLSVPAKSVTVTPQTEPKPVLGTTREPQLGEYRYSVDGRTLRRGVVVNESWIGEGANAVKWDGGGVNSNMGMTLEEAQTKLDAINSEYQNRQKQKDQQYQNQRSQIEAALVISPKSKFLQSLQTQLSPSRLLSPKQMQSVSNIKEKKFTPTKKGETREIYRQGEKIVQFYVPKSGWVDESEYHEYIDEDN